MTVWHNAEIAALRNTRAAIAVKVALFWVACLLLCLSVQ